MVIITVIITAYDRKEFIITATESVLNQSIPKKDYELIVVKNYNDKIIDDYLKKNMIKNIYSEDKSLGGKLADAIKVSRGEIISFLEDDDTFAENKLYYVQSLFTKNNDLAYYHNGYTPVNEKRTIAKYNNNSPDFNMSCISIRKEIVDADKIIGITDSIDTFMYLSAVESRKLLMADRRKLTFYMVHSSASNIFLRDFKDFNAARITYINNVIETLELFVNFFDKDKARRYLKSQITYYRILGFVYNRKCVPGNIINFLINNKNGFAIKAKYALICVFLRFSSKRYRSYIQHRIYKRGLENK